MKIRKKSKLGQNNLNVLISSGLQYSKKILSYEERVIYPFCRHGCLLKLINSVKIDIYEDNQFQVKFFDSAILKLDHPFEKEFIFYLKGTSRISNPRKFLIEEWIESIPVLRIEEEEK